MGQMAGATAEDGCLRLRGRKRFLGAVYACQGHMGSSPPRGLITALCGQRRSN
eukprot:CAMPEP_0179314306 /NCGR_PEP_ID=MMETSP0797-20121207/54358_1 /TAXON_ID=47934 /ORGANISM="Dinophysis acuminata, Strain DAEP01" /LENGTH=52 /DNA_ID=CAMNT_0021024555 /DNA_START=102 /DNA_END=260 /DNA_ORIENTATION=+